MRGRRVLGAATAAAIVMTAIVVSTTSTGARPYGPRSYWYRALGPDAPRRASSNNIIGFLARDNTANYVTLAGTTSEGKWGLPIYHATGTTKTYDVRNSCSYGQPPEFNHVRIPRGAKPDPTSDSAMVVYDRHRGLVYGFWHARHDVASDRWSACGGTVSYLRSNGLDGNLRASNERRNTGHRGLPPPTWAVRYSEIRNGAIHHVLRIAVNSTGCAHVFPMVNDECGTRAAGAPPEGTRIRIKPSVSLKGLHLSRAAMVIARALKRYGAIIGDQSGGDINLKVENTIAEGRGWLWKGRLGPDSLRKIPLSDYEVVG